MDGSCINCGFHPGVDPLVAPQSAGPPVEAGHISTIVETPLAPPIKSDFTRERFMTDLKRASTPIDRLPVPPKPMKGPGIKNTLIRKWYDTNHDRIVAEVNATDIDRTFTCGVSHRASGTGGLKNGTCRETSTLRCPDTSASQGRPTSCHKRTRRRPRPLRPSRRRRCIQKHGRRSTSQCTSS